MKTQTAGVENAKSLATSALEYHKGLPESGVTLFVSDRLNPVAMAQTMGFFDPDQIPKMFFFCSPDNASSIADYFPSAAISLFIDCVSEVPVMTTAPGETDLRYGGGDDSPLNILLKKGTLRGMTLNN